MWSDELVGTDLIWRRSDGQVTDELPNFLTGAGPAVVAGGGNGVNPLGAANPYVIPMRPGYALYIMRNQYPTITEEKRRLRFGTLSQEISPIKDYYRKVHRAGTLLNFPETVITDQFFRGLSPDNVIEVERIGIERPVKDLVTILDRVEKRKAEMHLGLSNRKFRQDQSHEIIPVQKPPVTAQEPTYIVPSSFKGYSPEDVNKMIQQAIQPFQSQIETLITKIPQVQQSPVEQSQPVRKSLVDSLQKAQRSEMQHYEDILAEDENKNKRYNEYLEFERHVNNNKDLMREINKTNRDMSTVIKMLKNLKLDDLNDMDTSNLMDGEVEYTTIAEDDNYVTQVVRKKK